MKIPKQHKPIELRKAAQYLLGGILASCAGVPSGDVGTCFFNDAGPTGGYNCTACCALRTSVSWMGPNNHIVNCNH